MDSRHDSFLESGGKDDFNGFMDIPSSPLSSLPPDFEDEAPQELEGIATDDSSVEHSMASPSVASANSTFESVPADSEEVALFSPEVSLRRSGRKRKAPARLNENFETDDTSEPEMLSRQTKQRKVSTSKPSHKGRGRGKDFSSIDMSPVSVDTVSPAHNASPESTRAEEESRSTFTSTPESRMFTIKVNPDKLVKIVHSAATPGSSSEDALSTNQTVPAYFEPESFSQANLSFFDTIGLGHISQSPQPSSETAEPDLVSLSIALTHKLPISQKPLPRGQPEIWADERWDLCESLRGLYNSRQGSYGGKEGVARSFMLDATSHQRDFMDEDVIILRASGDMEKDGKGAMKQKQDQGDKPQVHAMINAINQQSPLAVICGDRNSLAPCKMPHKYNSLDWYKPTDVWMEKDEFKVFKYRLERLDPTTVTGWWVPENHQPIVKLGSLEPPLKQCCGSCQTTFAQIYLCGWMCFNGKCDAFWTLPDGSKPDPAQLLYDPRFLKKKTSWTHEKPPSTFSYPLYKASAIAGEDYKVQNLNGMTCPECGKCNTRTKWAGWECSGCGFQHMPKINILPASAVQDQNFLVTDAYAASYDTALPSVNVSVEFSHNYRWITYSFPVSATEVAEIVHGVANKVVREEQEGPNEMWEYLQENCLGMERRRLANGHMNSFTLNYGMPYKFIAAGQSLPFTGAPWPITEAVARMNWADRITSKTAPEDQQKFNELYLVAYLEGQSMNFHDDGEDGLGSTVATLSLGARADMAFRPKQAYYHGLKEITRKGKKMQVMTLEEPLPEFPNYKERMKFIEEIKSVNLSQDEREKRLAEMAQELRKLSVGVSGKVPNYMNLSLGHGDIVIMRGAHLQKWFEHNVTPKGLMRYALTCRTILPGHLKRSELPDYEVELVQDTYDGSRIA